MVRVRVFIVLLSKSTQPLINYILVHRQIIPMTILWYLYTPILLVKQTVKDRKLLLADVVSWVSKPCRCLFHITPVIPNRQFIPSSHKISSSNGFVSLPHTSNEIWTFILEIYIVSVLCQLTKDS